MIAHCALTTSLASTAQNNDTSGTVETSVEELCSTIPLTPASAVQFASPGIQLEQPVQTSGSAFSTHIRSDLFSTVDNHSLDLFQPLLDPDMLDLFPSGELPDMSAFESGVWDLDHFEIDDWNDFTNFGGRSGWNAV